MTPTEHEARGLAENLGFLSEVDSATLMISATLARAEARGRAEGLREAAGIATGVDQEDPTVAGHAALFKTISRILDRAAALDAATEQTNG
jgi:hypothetical protein